MSKKQITKGQVGNALTSTAADHILGVTNDIFDEEQQEYQQELNRRLLQSAADAQGSLTTIETVIGGMKQQMLTVVEKEPHTGIRDPLDHLLPLPPPDPEEPDTPDPEKPDTPDKTKLVWGASKWGQAIW